jgi:hypothetical protein
MAWPFATGRLEGLRSEPRAKAPRTIDDVRIDAVIFVLRPPRERPMA